MKTQFCGMKIQLSEVWLKERSFGVALLHQTMAVLGFPASPQEVKENHAGNSTGEKFKKLREHFNVPEAIQPPIGVNLRYRLVDQAVALAIANILHNECLSDVSHLFELAGILKLKRGAIRKNRYILVAFDLNLRGLAAYRRIENVAEMIGNDGFKFLGHAAPDSHGRYRIFFYDWQYLRKQRKADVVVFAIAEGRTIVGFSRLIHTDDYLDVRQVSDLDVLVGDEEEQTEYTALVKELEQFIHANGTSWLEIAGSSEQLAYAAQEMEIPLSQLNIAATVERLLFHKNTTVRTREWMYGLGRQDIQLSWEALHKKTKDELYTTIAQSVAEKIIDAFEEAEQAEILKLVRECSIMHLLEPPSGHVEDNSLNAMLTHALPQVKDRQVFVDALGSFEGANYSEFWRTHLPAHPGFQDNPAVISKLLLTQQYTLLTGNHQKLVATLHAKANSIRQLVALEAGDWITMIKDTGVPDFVTGSTEEEKIERYASQMQELVNAAFPTLRIANMIEKKELPIKNDSVLNDIRMFLAENPDFDISRSRIDNFDQSIGAVAGNDSAEVKSELQTIQRLFQCCTSPKTLSVLKGQNLHSAFAIANIPRKVFVETHAKALGGEMAANAIHQRADNIRTKNEMVAVHLQDISHGLVPQLAMDDVGHNDAVEVIQKQIPNYAELFGSPDICECENCRSVYSPAAYFVDVLRFLEKSAPNSSGKTPYDVLVGTPDPNSPDKFIGGRRPDLAQLKLSCENTNTIIPYIDLVNEVMEFYAANDNNLLDGFQGHDTGDATPEELRANPQNVNVDAYRVLKDSKFPFTLPYHQPLDAIRTYSNHLGVSRYQVLMAINPLPDTVATRAIAAESLSLSEEEYKILTKRDFRDERDSTPLHNYFGYSDATRFSEMQNEKDADGNPRGVRPLLERSGLTYKELVEIIKTRFINPSLGFFEVVEEIFSLAAKSTGSSDGSTNYNLLEHVAAGTESPEENAAIIFALVKYYEAKGFPPDSSNKPLVEFKKWVVANFAGFQQVMTLFEPLSRCDLDTTQLMTLQKIYEDTGEATEYDTASGISFDAWSKLHRFVRLWRKLGWSIQQTDLILRALDQTGIIPDTIRHLEVVSALTEATRQPLDHLAVLWGNIGSEGEKSLYEKLFLNKAVQQIDEVFKVNTQGNFPRDSSEILAEHQSAILAAFGIKENELNAILRVARVIDVIEVEGVPQDTLRPIDMSKDKLNLPNLSTLYRHVILAKGLKMRITDLCTLIDLYLSMYTDDDLFDAQPFSVWHIVKKEFTLVSPEKTYQFYELAASTKQAGFKPWELEYILRGSLPADSKYGLDADKIHATVKVIRDAFSVIEQDYPAKLVEPTPEAITAILSLTFQPEIVSRLLGIVTGTATFDIGTPANLEITIPKDLVDKYTYIKASGRLSSVGIMTDDERTVLKALPNTNAEFQTAVETLYLAPEVFIHQNFAGVFSDLAQVAAVLLDRPSQVPAANLAQKHNYIYEHFLPLIKRKLRQDVITEKIASLISLDEARAARVMANDLDQFNTELSIEGFTATYYNDINWQTEAFPARTDNTIDYDWGANSPVSADNFSVRWQGYIAAPASGQYTLVVEVKGEDNVFNLYLDGALILEKSIGDNTLSWETLVELNAAQMHLLKLDYAESSNNAGVQLYWKTSTTARDILPASAAYPTAIIDKFTKDAIQLHRAAKFISGFNMSETELDHFITHVGDFDHINFKALGINHWQRIRDYSNLRNAVPQAQAPLTDVFALANTPSPQPTVEMLTEKLAQATAWPLADVAFLSTSPNFNMGIDDFKNEIALNRIRHAMQIVTKTGISANTITKWGTVETDFEVLHDTAQQLKNTVKAKYEDDDWLDVASNLSNTIRENQKQALISHLLTLPAVKEWGARDADGLFEYLLIDVQMGACMDTSRIVQATAAVQMFINRCLLNLENEVSPKAIDKDRWEWMKNYRVWEANRKVFLYFENWLEPEWRNDRSEFFKELESHLVQNDITARSVEQGLRNYLTSLNEVANLEMCGMHREDKENGDLKYLHVFGRTPESPNKYFYRRWDEHRKWSAWEKVQVDIRSVEDGGNSGVHLIPVVWKKRLFLFWPEFMEVMRESNKSQTQTFQDMGQEKTSALNPKKFWEIRLAWSEYVDGKWSSKQVTKEYVSTEQFLGLTELKSFHFTPKVLPNTRDLSIQIIYESRYGPVFIISDIQSPVKVLNGPLDWLDWSFIPFIPKPLYKNSFSGRTRFSKFELLDNVYLKTKTNHQLLPDDGFSGLDLSLRNPFFFSDERRTYFVSTSDITVWEFKHPELYPPIDPADKIYTFNSQIKNPGFSPGNSNIKPGVISSGTAGTSVSKIADTRSPFSAPYEKRSGFFSTRTRTTKGLAFHTFYHPFSSQYVTNLNQGGVPGLMASDTSITSDDGETFIKNYDPNFHQNRVKKTSGNRTDYKENICFDAYGANSLYNWELFFHAPLYIATRLSKNGKYDQAEHWFRYIFDPTTDATPATGESEISRYWKVLPFKTEQATKSLEELFRELNNETDPSSPDYNPDSEFSGIVSAWRDSPFDPHLIASNRPLAYMKNVVIKYVENLIAWGDSLFRRFSRESVNEAIQIYVIANHILGPRPEMVPKRGKIATESYASLQKKWDDFGNALVALENIFPYSSAVNSSNDSTGASFLGIGSALYFCIPANDKLLHYWDTVVDRLFKIRHCQDIDGVERSLALFSAPIDPAALIQANSQGLSLGSILADLSSPPPIYRFAYLIQKANEFCGDVKALGSALLSTLEKKDGEELSRLRASHETTMIELVTAIRERQVLAAKANKENLLKVRETAKFRLQHYKDLLGDDSDTPPDAPSLDATLTADSQLPTDTSIPLIEADVDMSLVDSDESGVKIIPREEEQLSKNVEAKWINAAANGTETLAGVVALIPKISAYGAPLGVGVEVKSPEWVSAIHLAANAARGYSNYLSAESSQASIMAGYSRRTYDFAFQGNLAVSELISVDKQIISADIQIQVAEKELQNHKQQIENTKEVELFLKDKFTNQELYQWMKEQLFSVYKQSYNLAYEMAKKAEKAYQYELGTETASFIQYGYWENSKQGLVAGEKLQLALRQLDKSYLEENRRELELTKSISLILLNPVALIELRETGKCYVSLPEELFDLDFQGHYFRRIKSVSLSIPCVTGPYTTVNCTLRLIKNTMRINTILNINEDPYEHDHDEGLWIDDDRFRSNNVPVTSIATSSGQNDAGMFEFNFRDERYLPFERAGAISNWMIELSTEKELRQFDYSTISDVILHLKYTARESGGPFKEKATEHAKRFIKNIAELADQPLMRMFSMKHEFPTEWHKFLHPESEEAEQILRFTIGKEKFPFYAQDSKVTVSRIDVFAKSAQVGDYQMVFLYIKDGGNVFTSIDKTLSQGDDYGGLHYGTINAEDIEELDIARDMSLSLAANPDEIQDMFLVFHYRLGA